MDHENKEQEIQQNGIEEHGQKTKDRRHIYASPRIAGLHAFVIRIVRPTSAVTRLSPHAAQRMMIRRE